MTDTIKLLNERAASYGALRQSSLTAVAMDCAAVELAALEAELSERVQELAAAHATIHQLGENAAKAAAEYAGRVAVLEAEIVFLKGEDRRKTEAMQDPNAVHVNLLRGTIARPTVYQMIHIYSPAKVRDGLETYARAALTEPTDG